MPRIKETLRKNAQTKAKALGHDMSKFFPDNHARCLVCGGALYVDPAADEQISGVCARLSCTSVLEAGEGVDELLKARIATPGKDLTESEKRAVMADVTALFEDMNKALDAPIIGVPPERIIVKEGLLSFDEAPTMIIPPRSEAYEPPPPRLNRHQRRMAQAKARRGLK